MEPPNKRHFTKEELEQIKELRLEKHLGPRAIGKVFGCGEKPIIRILKELGLPDCIPQGNINYLTDEDIKELIEEYLKGASLKSLAEKYKIWIPNIRKLIKARNLKVRQKKHSEETAQKVKQMFLNSGLTLRTISTTLGVNIKAVLRIIADLVRIVPVKIKERDKYNLLDLWIEKYGPSVAQEKWDSHIETKRKNASGANNPMYGRPSPRGAGQGWKLWYKGFYCRSLREVSFILELEIAGKTFKTGETLVIPYNFMGKEGTYRPDFIVDDKIYEIKPIRLIRSPRVLAKTAAAEKFCTELNLTYVIRDCKIDSSAILAAYHAGDIVFDKRYEEKFKEYINKTKSLSASDLETTAS